MIRQVAAGIVISLLLICGTLRVVSNLNSRHYPPAACLLMGGTWGLWSGWKCY